jgi:hypothetical protein
MASGNTNTEEIALVECLSTTSLAKNQTSVVESASLTLGESDVVDDQRQNGGSPCPNIPVWPTGPKKLQENTSTIDAAINIVSLLVPICFLSLAMDVATVNKSKVDDIKTKRLNEVTKIVGYHITNNPFSFANSCPNSRPHFSP